MSSISSVGSVGQGLAAFFQKLSSDPTAATATDSTSTASSSGQAVQGAGHHHRGHHGGGGGGDSALFGKIQSAVTSALQQAQGSGSTDDPNQVVQNAIAGVLNGSASTSGATATTADGSTPTDPDATASGTPGATTDPAAGQQAFFSTLQSYGIDPKQFQQDFAAAVKSAQNGNPDFATAFKNFPPGTSVDEIA